MGNDVLLPPDEIIRLLHKFTAHENRGSGNPRRVNLCAIAAMAGVARWSLNRYMLGRRQLPEYVQSALSPILRDIENGKIRFDRFERSGREWRIDYRQPPVRMPPPQPRVIRAEDYNEWSCCQSCGGPRFSSFRSDRVYFACDSCVSLTDRRMLGSR